MSTRNDLADTCALMGKFVHAMNNRLSAIMINIDSALLAKSAEPSFSPKFLQSLKDQSYCMSHILEAMQILTSIPALHPTKENINQLLLRSVELAKFLQNTKQVKFVTHLTHQHSPNVLIDKAYMEKCLMYLLEFLLLATPKNGQITLSTEERTEDSSIRITMAATGLQGRTDYKKVLSSFSFSYKNNEELQLQLGIMLAKRIVSFFNGRITINGHDGQGISITIVLPQTLHDDTKLSVNHNSTFRSYGQDVPTA